MFNTQNIKFNSYKFKKIKKTLKNINNKWFNEFDIIKTFKDDYKYSYNKKIIKKLGRYNTFRIIGMGGSILGTEAIHQFLNHRIKKKFIFFNNLQNRNNFQLNNKKIFNIIVSKSGDTLETIINANKLTNQSIKNNLFIIGNNVSYLNLLAKKLKSEIIEHKNFVGGRYSVLSEVGMLPAELMGFNEKKFKRFKYLINKKNFINFLIKNVNETISLIKKKKSNSIILNYDENSDNLFKWYQQLISESLGKKSKGILPIISSMPKDNHSLLQLYLDGPKNNFFTFFSVKDKKSIKLNNKLVINYQYYLKNKSIGQVIESQKKATQNVFFQKKIPFRNIEVKNRNEESIGELFCFFILETILLGRALGVNPFDQPSVELVKTETKKYLVNSKK